MIEHIKNCKDKLKEIINHNKREEIYGKIKANTWGNRVDDI